MKNILLLTLTFLLFALNADSQIKVFTSGATKVGATTTGPASGAKFQVTGGNTILSNFLGVGTSTPQRMVHVRGNNGVFRLDRDASAPGFIISRNQSGFSSVIKTFFVGVDGSSASTGHFTIADMGQAVGGNAPKRLVIDSDGSVIIGGNISSNFKLDVLGDARKTSGGDHWNMVSDKRTKSNIKKINNSLDLITQLNPVEYNYNGLAGTKKGEYQIGVLAQELKEVAPFMVQEFTFEESDGILREGEDQDFEKSSTKSTYLSVNASALKWLLVSAMKEQQQIIENQNLQIKEIEENYQDLKNQLALLKEAIGFQTSSNDEVSTPKGFLGQNVPNPFSEYTNIEFSLPSKYSKASLYIYSEAGQVIKIINVNDSNNLYRLSTVDFASGIYYYQLIVDEKVVGSKNMLKL